MTNRTASHEATKEADVSLAGLGKIIGTVEHDGALLVLCTLGVLRRDGDRLVPLNIGAARLAPVQHSLWGVSIEDAVRYGEWPNARLRLGVQRAGEFYSLSTLGDVRSRGDFEWQRLPNFGRASTVMIRALFDDWDKRADEVLAAWVRSGLMVSDGSA